MPLQLENDARAAYQAITPDSRAKMGACVTVLPDADELQEYLTTLRAAWSQGWCNQPARYPHLLLRLYHCVAFLRYEGNAFWASFGEAVGDHRIPSNPNRQTEINDVLDHISRHVGLEILHGTAGTRLCVQSAVRQQCPRVFLRFIISNAASNSNEVASARGIAHESFDFREGHSPNTGQKRPLVGMWIEIRVKKSAVAVGARHVLQRQGDEVAKAAFGHRVLARKETVVGVEAKLMATLHRACQNGCTEFSGETRR